MTDNAKELLALADKYEQSITTMRAMGRPSPAEYQMIIDALRLSARQQASVESILAEVVLQADTVYADERNDIQDRRAIRRFADRFRLNSDDSDDGWAARALLAKYDIFEKVEG